MNESHNTNDARAHLSGAALEALAAGESADAAAAQHLTGCAQCRATVAAMSLENRLFARELTTANRKGTPMASNVVAYNTDAKIAPYSHKPLVFYAVAASVMLVAALGLIYLGKHAATSGSDAKKELASATSGKTPPQNTAGEKDKDKTEEPAPNGTEPTYEGRTAAQWAGQLKKELTMKWPITPEGTKAAHALSQLGMSALPQILELSRATDEHSAEMTSGIIKKMTLEPSDFPRMRELLKSDGYETRRTGVQLLETLGHEQPSMLAQVRDVLQAALNDRDKAVAETARGAVAELSDNALWLSSADDSKSGTTTEDGKTWRVKRQNGTVATVQIDKALPLGSTQYIQLQSDPNASAPTGPSTPASNPAPGSLKVQAEKLTTDFTAKLDELNALGANPDKQKLDALLAELKEIKAQLLALKNAIDVADKQPSAPAPQVWVQNPGNTPAISENQMRLLMNDALQQMQKARALKKAQDEKAVQEKQEQKKKDDGF